MGSKPAHPARGPRAGLFPSCSLLQPSPYACVQVCALKLEHVSSGISYLHPFFLMMFPNTTSALQKRPRRGDFITGQQKPQAAPHLAHQPQGPLGENTTWPRAANVCLGPGCSFQSEESTWEQRGPLPVEVATAVCHCPSTAASAPIEEGGATSCSERPAAPLPWPLRNSPGKTLGNVTWVVSRQVCFIFFLNRLFTKHISVCRDNQQVLRADFPAECVRVCVCP